ncbi:hypothetical protein F5B17DRAFT_336339 [Nemania serpens]|nr:hypothetical protein F5B17DRAFT_336339 [Nemania serpens]
MFRHFVVVVLVLVALGISTPVGLSDPRAAAMSTCLREAGIYDVCDTIYSYLRCKGRSPMMSVDCAQEPGHYCLIKNDRGSCTGLSPPPMNITLSR